MDCTILLSPTDDPTQNQACLESLLTTLPKGWRGEVIVVAEKKQERQGPLLPVEPLPATVRWSRYDGEPSGRWAALNHAAKGSRARTLCFVEAGTTFAGDWWGPLWRTWRAVPEAGCVGNVHREPYSGLIDHVGVGFGADGRPVVRHQKSPVLPREPWTRRAAVTFACCLVSRAAFARVGGFDAGFQGPLGAVDLCLRMAEAGFRHHVANHSAVYHQAESATEGPDPDLARYDARWGQRAQQWHARRVALDDDPDAHFAPERWERARDERKRFRQQVDDHKHVGYRYLAKHWHRPWRYNYGRVIHALAQALEPRPVLLPRPPRHFAGFALPDGHLFDPPSV